MMTQQAKSPQVEKKQTNTNLYHKGIPKQDHKKEKIKTEGVSEPKEDKKI